MTVQVDSRETSRARQRILPQFDQCGVRYFVSKLPVGDYCSLDNMRFAIDRKQSLNELVLNVCQQHARFTAELQRAKDLEIQLVILVEHGGPIRSMEDIKSWVNPRLGESPLAMSGERLHRVLSTMANKYGVRFEFCAKHQTGKRIIQMLEDAK